MYLGVISHVLLTTSFLGPKSCPVLNPSGGRGTCAQGCGSTSDRFGEHPSGRVKTVKPLSWKNNDVGTSWFESKNPGDFFWLCCYKCFFKVHFAFTWKIRCSCRMLGHCLTPEKDFTLPNAHLIFCRWRRRWTIFSYNSLSRSFSGFSFAVTSKWGALATFKLENCSKIKSFHPWICHDFPKLRITSKFLIEMT